MDFTGKTALITGASVGIGRAAAMLFAQRGANVVLVDVNRETLAVTEAELQEYAERILCVVCDVSDNAAVLKTAEAAVERFGKVDILVNNAGIWRQRGLFTELQVEDWIRIMNVNVLGTVQFTKALLPGMITAGYGRVINIASVAGVYGNSKMSHYSASKGAVISLTKALAKEVAEQGVTVNSISPGTVSDSGNPDIDHHSPSNLSYMGRTGTDRENAELILFLAGDAAAYINGENIIIDGCRKKL